MRTLTLNKHVIRDNIEQASFDNLLQYWLNYHNGNIVESEMVFFILKALDPGDHFVDVGANIGYFSSLASLLVGQSGRVTAIEPGTNNLQSLEARLASLPDKNWEILPVLLSDKQGKLDFYQHENDGSWNTMGLPPPSRYGSTAVIGDSYEKIQCESTTLDALFSNQREPIRIIKIDTEGAESLICRGGLRLFKKNPPDFLLIEINENFKDSIEGNLYLLRQYLCQFSYQAYILDKDGKLPWLIPHSSKILFQDNRGSYVFNLLFTREDRLTQLFSQLRLGDNF